MIELLYRPNISVSSRAPLKRMLRAGPWCWPPPDDTHAAAMARTVSGLETPPTVPGQAPLLTVCDKTGVPSLWIMLDDEHPLASRSLGALEFGKGARKAWDHAAAALPRSLPLLWAPMKQARAMSFVALRLASLAGSRAIRLPDTRLDGASFGLSFVLALASLVFKRPVPEDLVASGQVTPTGAVKAVDGIGAKVEVVVRRTRRVRRFLVAPDNLREARSAARGGPLEIVPVRSAAEAVEVAFGNDLGQLLVNQGRDEAQREELCGSFYRLALSGRDAALDWTPVMRAAGLALESWEADLTEAQRSQLLFAHAVAARHEGAAGADALPDRAWIDLAPADLRIKIVANFVQEATDKGTLSPRVAEDLAREHLVEGRDAFAHHLGLLGALGRLLAITGKTEEALRLQEQAAQGFFDRLAYASISFPLSEWYRLAGALGDPAAFERAEALFAKVEQLEGFDDSGMPYVRLARARGQALLGREGAESTLTALARGRGVPDHVRWSAIRWLCFVLASTDHLFEASEWLSEIQEDLDAHRGHAATAETFLRLSHLDLALALGNEARRDHALERLEALQRHPVGTLMAHRPEGTPAGEYVARFYPY